MKTIIPVFLLLLGLVQLQVAASTPVHLDEEEGYSEAELDQMLAPIALYPDALLAQILIGATYPLEIVQAARWTRAHPGLEGTAAMDAVIDKGWDPAVQALVSFPDVLSRMSDDLEWMQRLGEAFLLQEKAVMDRIQGLRQRAYAAGTLELQEHIRVQKEREVIVIEPADPAVIYVPYYRPEVVYGGWWWPAYPAVYWEYTSSMTGGSYFFWSTGIRVSSGFHYSRWDWPARQIVVVNVNVYPRSHRYHGHRRPVRSNHSQRWEHSPTHRRGVAYRHQRLNREYRRGGERDTAYTHSRHERPVLRSNVSGTDADLRAEGASQRSRRAVESGSFVNDSRRRHHPESVRRESQRSERVRNPEAQSEQRQQRQQRVQQELERGRNRAMARREGQQRPASSQADQRAVRSRSREGSNDRRPPRTVAAPQPSRPQESTQGWESTQRRSRPQRDVSQPSPRERRQSRAEPAQGSHERGRSAEGRSGGSGHERSREGGRGRRSE